MTEINRAATWTATPQQVERVIAAVLPHTSGDDYIPILGVVRVEVENERFLAVATDRYTLAVCRADLTEWAEDAVTHQMAQASIRAADFRRLFAFLRPQRKDPAAWTLTDKSLTVSIGEQSLTVRTVEIDFVHWRKVLGGLTGAASSPAGSPVMRFTPAKIESFLKSAKALGEESGSILWNFGAAHTDAPIIRIGDSFVGALMPQRMPEEAPAIDLTPLGIESPKPVAA